MSLDQYISEYIMKERGFYERLGQPLKNPVLYMNKTDYMELLKSRNLYINSTFIGTNNEGSYDVYFMGIPVVIKDVDHVMLRSKDEGIL